MNSNIFKHCKILQPCAVYWLQGILLFILAVEKQIYVRLFADVYQIMNIAVTVNALHHKHLPII